MDPGQGEIMPKLQNFGSVKEKATVGQETRTRLSDFKLCELQADHARTRVLFDPGQTGCWGYTPITEELWEWRTIRRPAVFPVRLFSARLSGEVEPEVPSPRNPPPCCVFSLVRAPVRRGGGREWITMLGDVTSRVPVDSTLIRAMLGPAPPEDAVISLCAVMNLEEYRALLDAGFRKTGEESAMILPLSRRGLQAIRRRPERWYTLTESVLGI